mgnify:CR=1 FL=1
MLDFFKKRNRQQIQVQSLEIDKKKAPDPVTLRISEISPSGEMTIFFSEKLKSFEDLNNEFSNNRMLQENFIDVKYNSNIDGCNPVSPELQDWYITSFDNDKMIIFLNMSNPVYVSSSEESCAIEVKIINQYMFQSIKTNVTIRENYKTSLEMPTMLSKGDVNTIMTMGESCKNSMLFTLIIPFCFMIFMSVSMDRVWSLYLML